MHVRAPRARISRGVHREPVGAATTGALRTLLGGLWTGFGGRSLSRRTACRGDVFLSVSSAGSRICLSVLTHDDGDSTATAHEVQSMHDHNASPVAQPERAAPAGSPSDEDPQPGPSHSMWWMVACCAPMVVIALAILLGVFGPR